MGSLVKGGVLDLLSLFFLSLSFSLVFPFARRELSVAQNV